MHSWSRAFSSLGFSYEHVTNLIQALLQISLHLWLQENKEYKDLKNKNVGDIYIRYC